MNAKEGKDLKRVRGKRKVRKCEERRVRQGEEGERDELRYKSGSS